MKTDLQIQKDVMDELKWQPVLEAAEIGVAVKHGIVTLSGQVDSYLKKKVAEKTVRKVDGVKAVAEDIIVGVSPHNKRTDAEIAQAVLNALQWHSGVQNQKIKINVEDGIVRLEGEAEWEYQRSNAKSAIEHLQGVRAVINAIVLKPKVMAADVKQQINAAFRRNAVIDAATINVTIINSKVVLNGTVRSFAEKQDAEKAVWNAPGVSSVENNLEIEVPEYSFVD